jgi:A/G-specific adenine glycosylase
MSYTSFRKIVWNHYKKAGRHTLPWRKTHNPYRILVSEVMLQQTQVERVIPYYRAFLKLFATAEVLANAKLSIVLRAWQGLGYNRRAKMLHLAANAIAKNGMPKTADAFDELPGVGPYTARAVAAFAYNHEAVFVETNIRTAVMHHFFKNKKQVTDREIEEILEKALPKGRARDWYAALMDYGAFLKRSGVRVNTKSVHYAKQKSFAGSMREARGAILRTLASSKGHTSSALQNLLGADRRAQLKAALDSLCAEGLIQRKHSRYALAE